MPERTNDFQQLVALIQRATADRNATVTESAMVPVAGLPYEREVDVLIETDCGLYRIKIAVEAKDHARPLDVVHVEQIVAKYAAPGNVVVNKVVLVTRSGLTSQAQAKARLAGIETVRIEEADRANWPGMLLPPSAPLEGFQIGPYPKEVIVEPIPEGVDSSVVKNAAVIKCTCPRCNGKVLGTPFVVAINKVNSELALNPNFNQALGFLKGKGGGAFDCNVELNAAHLVAELDGASWKLTRFAYVAHTRWGRGTFEVKAYRMAGDDLGVRHVQHGTFSAAGYKVDIVFADPKDPSKSTLKLSEAAEEHS